MARSLDTGCAVRNCDRRGRPRDRLRQRCYGAEPQTRLQEVCRESLGGSGPGRRPWVVSRSTSLRGGQGLTAMTDVSPCRAGPPVDGTACFAPADHRRADRVGRRVGLGLDQLPGRRLDRRMHAGRRVQLQRGHCRYGNRPFAWSGRGFGQSPTRSCRARPRSASRPHVR